MPNPILDRVDRQWIESFRAKHDPQASRIEVHFTLAFPMEASPNKVESEMAAVSRSTSPISFVIRRSEVVRDVLTGGIHIVLVPDEGGVPITTLHGRLYGGRAAAPSAIGHPVRSPYDGWRSA